MKKAAQGLGTLILNGEHEIGQVFHVTALGKSPMNTTPLSTGCVLDCGVKTKFCHVCKVNSNA